MQNAKCPNWEQLSQQFHENQSKFLRSFKCLNKQKLPSRAVIEYHLHLIEIHFNTIVNTFNNTAYYLTPEHRQEIFELITKLKTKVQSIEKRLQKELVIIFRENGCVTITLEEIDYGSILENSNIWEQFEDIDHDLADSKMEPIKFIELATKILPEFDGKFKNLQKFLDALNLLESLKETHENLAVQIIQTKISGTARISINDLTSIAAIADKLKTVIKGDSTDILVSKLMTAHQGSKPNSVYAQEIDELSKMLSNAYISDGLPPQIANKYAVQATVKALAKNLNNDRTRIIIEAATFDTIDQITEKIMSTDIHQSSVSNVLQLRGRYRWGRQRYPNGRLNYNNQGSHTYRGDRHYQQTNRGNPRRVNRQNNYRPNSNNNHSRTSRQHTNSRQYADMRVMNRVSGNPEDPQITLGEE